MADPTQKKNWMTGLRESNAIGWLGFAVLIAVIAVSALVFGGKNPQVADTNSPPAKVAQ
jgi:hypothetical protein